jgi:predicted RNA polymerase sigma factor
VHDEAARAEDTDWPQVLALYEVLRRVDDNPMVALNHAVAAAMVRGPAAGLALLEALDADARVRGHHRLAAVRTASVPERDYLTLKAARLAGAES